MAEQLIQKDCKTGEYRNIFPVTSISSIKNLETGETLDQILENCNHLYLTFKDKSKTNTRLQVPSHMRRKGLWITYLSCKNNLITEYYNSTDFSNKAWGDSKNWVPYLNDTVIEESIEKKIGWYKA